MNFIDLKKMQLQQCFRIKQHELGPGYNLKKIRYTNLFFNHDMVKRRRKKKDYMDKVNLI